MRNDFRSRVDRFIHHQYTDTAIMVLIVISVVFVLVEVTLPLDDPLSNLLIELDWILIGIFVVELSLRFYVAPRKSQFFRRYWIDIIAIMPLFRTFRILRVLRLLRIFRMGVLVNRRISRFSTFFTETYGEYLTIGLLVLVIILGGAVSIFLLENEAGMQNPAFQSFDKSFYWALYTLIAGEMGPGQPQTLAGKIITIIVMLSGLTLFAMFTGIVSAAMVQKLKLTMDDKFMELEDLHGHIVICGWNRKGRPIIEELQSDKVEQNRRIVIIAQLEHMPIFDPKVVNKEMIYFLPDDYTSLEILKRANIQEAAKAIILADRTRDRTDQDRDARTVLTALTIEKMNPGIFTCAELLNDDNEVHLKMAGVEEVIVGDDYTATVLATATANQGMVHVIKELFTVRYGNQMFKITANDKVNKLTFLGLIDYLKEHHDAIPVSVERKDDAGVNQTYVNPPGHYVIKTGDQLIIICREKFLL